MSNMLFLYVYIIHHAYIYIYMYVLYYILASFQKINVNVTELFYFF